MQRAAAATMPTTMPVVLLLSRTTSDGPGKTFTSGSGGRAVRWEGRRYIRREYILIICITWRLESWCKKMHSKDELFYIHFA